MTAGHFHSPRMNERLGVALQIAVSSVASADFSCLPHSSSSLQGAAILDVQHLPRRERSPAGCRLRHEKESPAGSRRSLGPSGRGPQPAATLDRRCRSAHYRG
ncbi:uncharacterized protein WM277_025029 isoform 1-T1 [Molossus nigricans]